MKTMRFQLNRNDEMYLFWMRFIDFVSETMFIVNRNRGSHILGDDILGEDPDDWPAEEDQRWKELEEADRKWCKDFKEYWDHSSFTMDKMFELINNRIHQKVVTQEEEITSYSKSEETAELRFQKLFGEIISHGLSYLMIIDVHSLVMLSLNEKSKTLLDILKEQRTKQKE
jgi:hypothetical protein